MNFSILTFLLSLIVSIIALCLSVVSSQECNFPVLISRLDLRNIINTGHEEDISISFISSAFKKWDEFQVKKNRLIHYCKNLGLVNIAFVIISYHRDKGLLETILKESYIQWVARVEIGIWIGVSVLAVFAVILVKRTGTLLGNRSAIDKFIYESNTEILPGKKIDYGKLVAKLMKFDF